MKICLAAIGFYNNDIQFNKNQIINSLKKYRNKADLILFGESFLQGFDALTFNYEKDKEIALSLNSKVIDEIRLSALKYNTGVSFGYFELDNDSIYSSQLVIDNNGSILFNYRRVSVGWKTLEASHHYKEGKEFSCFQFLNKKITIGLCGDLWYQDNLNLISKLNADLILWPVYTDFNYDNWNKIEKYEYLKQVSKLSVPILYLNSYSLDMKNSDSAKGGAVVFYKGKIMFNLDAGSENYLIVDI